jgi:ribonucleoside-diphosphate reductase alpha chain
LLFFILLFFINFLSLFQPYFALAYYYKGILGGDVQLSYVNKHLQRALEDRGIYSPELMDKIIKKGSLQRVREVPKDIRDIFVTSMDITAEDHILMQAAMQRFCENAISKTINFPNKATHNDVFLGYLTAWKMGCKGCTVYRDGSRFLQVLNLNDDDNGEEEVEEETIQVDTENVTVEMELTIPEKKRKVDEKDSIRENIPEVERKQRRITLVPFCQDCQKSMTPMEGCHTCLDCGNSLCSK